MLDDVRSDAIERCDAGGVGCYLLEEPRRDAGIVLAHERAAAAGDLSGSGIGAARTSPWFASRSTG